MDQGKENQQVNKNEENNYQGNHKDKRGEMNSGDHKERQDKILITPNQHQKERHDMQQIDHKHHQKSNKLDNRKGARLNIRGNNNQEESKDWRKNYLSSMTKDQTVHTHN